MEIHLVSSLTPDDERRLAPAMLAAIGRILDRLPVTYSVRLETATGTAIQHHRTAAGPPDADPLEALDRDFDLATQPARPPGPVAILDRD